jgi:hypothetical protein
VGITGSSENSIFRGYLDIELDQCCQGAEVSAAKLKKGRNKFGEPGKSGAELLPDLSKKDRKWAELFLGLVFIKSSIFPAQN